MMPPRGETVPFLYKPEPIFHVKAEELAQHGFDLGVADYLCLRMFQDQRLNRGGMVRLHVGDHQIVKRSSIQGIGQIFKEGTLHSLVHRVKKHRLFIQQQIGIVGDPVGHAIYPLEAGKPPVIRSYPDQIVQNFSNAMHIISFLPPVPAGGPLLCLSRYFILPMLELYPFEAHLTVAQATKMHYNYRI